MCIVAALGIEAIRKKIPRYSEVAISIVMSAGIGLAGVLSGFVENGASLNSFLFGSIVSISEGELALVVVISVLVLAAVLFFTGNYFISDLMKMRQGSPVFPCGILIFFLLF